MEIVPLNAKVLWEIKGGQPHQSAVNFNDLNALLILQAVNINWRQPDCGRGAGKITLFTYEHS